jgi:hypothetical protein
MPQAISKQKIQAIDIHEDDSHDPVEPREPELDVSDWRSRGCDLLRAELVAVESCFLVCSCMILLFVRTRLVSCHWAKQTLRSQRLRCFHRRDHMSWSSLVPQTHCSEGMRSGYLEERLNPW